MSLRNAIRNQAAALDGARGTYRIGIIQSYDKNTYTARVLFQPENVLSGWLPIKSIMSGSGMGVQAGPSAGDQAWVAFQEDDSEAGVIQGFQHSDLATPQPVPSGEVWATAANGATFKLHADGTITSAGTWTHTGNIICSGTITSAESIINGLAHSTHAHSDPQGGKTGGPTSP